MSDTPETDAFIGGLAHEVKTSYTLESFARRLERERDEARQIAELYRDCWNRASIASKANYKLPLLPLPWERKPEPEPTP